MNVFKYSTNILHLKLFKYYLNIQMRFQYLNIKEKVLKNF